MVLAARSGDRFIWDTAAVNVDLKARNLRLSSNLTPDYAQIVGAWRERGGIIETTEERDADFKNA